MVTVIQTIGIIDVIWMYPNDSRYLINIL